MTTEVIASEHLGLCRPEKEMLDKGVAWLSERGVSSSIQEVEVRLAENGSSRSTNQVEEGKQTA